LLAIVFGLISALSWGGGDFAGGLASRRVGPFRAVLFAEVIGQVFLLAALAIFREPLISTRGLLIAFCAGGIGSLGLLILYQAMATGKMSIAAPVSALLAAALPVIFGTLTAGLPKITQLGGFVLALGAIWLVSQSEGDQPHLERLSDLRLPLLAGLGFGTYFILMHGVAQEATLWPMIASRTGGMLFLGVVVLIIRHESLIISRADWPLVTLSGTLDVGGNLFYILAAQAGRMDLAAVLSSLYPGMTALLAWLLLKEHISNGQRLGILAALLAIGLLTI
jgi:drug/metabolite transporter (DMT)-like permease